MPQAAPAPSLHQLVTFELFDETFALPIFDVREVIRIQPLTPVPQAPAFIEGVINLRGQIIPVVDLRKRFGLPPQPTTPHSRIIITQPKAGLLVGLVVDTTRQVERIPATAIQPAPELLTGSIGAAYIQGLSSWQGNLLVHLNLQRIFAPDEHQALPPTPNPEKTNGP